MGTPGLPWDHPDSDPAADLRAFAHEAQAAWQRREVYWKPSPVMKHVDKMVVFGTEYNLYKILDRQGLVALPWRIK